MKDNIIISVISKLTGENRTNPIPMCYANTFARKQITPIQGQKKSMNGSDVGFG